MNRLANFGSAEARAKLVAASRTMRAMQIEMSQTSQCCGECAAAGPVAPGLQTRPARVSGNGARLYCSMSLNILAIFVALFSLDLCQ